MSIQIQPHDVVAENHWLKLRARPSVLLRAGDREDAYATKVTGGLALPEGEEIKEMWESHPTI